MAFIEFETWRVAAGNQAEHDQMIRDWFDFVRDNHAALFAEWKSARYYRETDRDGNPTGLYIMLFEFHSIEGHHAYKERRKDWDGPYEAYKQVDPYQLFEPNSVTTDYWQPLESDSWLDFS